VTERTVEGILQRGPQDPSPPGRHRPFDDHAERRLVRMVIDRFQRGAALTQKELLKLVGEEKRRGRRGGDRRLSVGIWMPSKWAAPCLRKIPE
jgi:hypothetical protein